jgi:CheY-like chemotaxis protein
MKRCILYVEDNPGDVRLVKEAFGDSRIENDFRVAQDGEEAVDYLWQNGKFADADRPDLILLDLNLPKKNGRELLEAIKQHEKLKAIPVVILSSSGAEKDILASYDHHANCYIQKPLNYDEYIEAVNRIEEFWLKTVKLPYLN